MANRQIAYTWMMDNETIYLAAWIARARKQPVDS
jgi:hypothetical protein